LNPDCSINPDLVSLVKRVETRAQQNKVTLIPTEELADVIRRQDQSPRSSVTFLKLVDPSPESRREFYAKWAQYERRVNLLGHVVGVLAQESQDADEVTHGALSTDQIYLIVRDELDPRPSPQDIEDALHL